MIVGGWRPARIVEASAATPHSRILRVEVAGWPGSEAGQHVDVRLTADDGYQAVRSYSLGSFGDGETIELAVDEVENGEVSSYLVEDVSAGDQLEIKGPLGGYFVWRPGESTPVQLIAGGSGIVPLIAIARARAASLSDAPFRMLYSVRKSADALYGDEVERLAATGSLDATWVYTRAAPPGWTGQVRRLDDEAIAAAVWPVEREPVFYVCGPTGFVEAVADALVRLGHPAARIKTERFGGS